MRVLMVTHRHKTFERNLARAVAGEVDLVEAHAVATLGGPAVDRTGHVARVAGGAYEVLVPAVRGRRFLGRPYREYVARRYVHLLDVIADAEGPVDLVHTHFYAAAGALPSLRRRTGLPYVVTEHSTALTGLSPDKTATPAGLRLARRVYDQAALVLPVSHSLEQAVRSISPGARTAVVPNPVDTSLFRTRDDRGAPRHELITVARLEPVKDLPFLLRAVGLLVDSGHDVALEIVGSGSEETALRALAADLGLDRRVTFAGALAQDQVAGRLADSDLFVSSSHIENLPTAVIEALCTGLPVVATNVGGLGELVDRSNGLLVESREVSELAGAIEVVLGAAPDAYAPAAIAAAADSRFGLAAVGAMVAEHYREVQSRSSTGS